MIKRPTVLILGAGASKEAGEFPTGPELRHTICESLTAYLFQKLNLLGYSEYDIHNFQDKLRRSNCPSVDAFLQRSKGFEQIGKAAIAAELLRLETGSDQPEGRLFNTDPKKNHWYNYFLETLDTDGFDNLDRNNVAIITFNYDRSLEHFLYTSVMARYGEQKSDEECRQKVEGIPLVHVYGSMGKLPWQTQSERASGVHTVGYGVQVTKRDPSILKEHADCIHIISEIDDRADTDRNFLRARDFVDQAETIIFLGFGYNRTNLSRLHIQKKLDSKTIWGTCLHLTARQEEDIRAFFNGKIELASGHDCLGFLRNHRALA